ncbi:FMRFamide-like neuropeptide 11 [Ditylenchus destructor]|uniref:FMRFamide-like neuropeptide 11 n=1 Tax=Ditylenchus destructor TaxID=166010 RepID=A0AAD4R601_9BILA|nr:FMRFamide-like neuropeptide 11 [Ditylenchus destructor]
MEKRQMRNALVRFGRSTGMRNALVRFGKRAPIESLADEIKRNGAPQPFVRFGRSTGGRSIDSWQDPSAVQTVDMPYY